VPLKTEADVTADLDLAREEVLRLAREYDIGEQVGMQWVFDEQDVLSLREVLSAEMREEE